MKRGLYTLCGVLWMVAFGLQAGPRTSASYTIDADIADQGGARATSANYTSNGSTGGATGIATVASPSEFSKNGYIGQLYEVTSLQVTATPTSVNETTTRQLAGTQLLDDGSSIVLTPGSISWSVLSGPVTSISAGGIASAGTVYQDTSASVQGSFGGINGSLNLTVVNTNIDNFGSYAGDTIDDAWQVQFFGQPPNTHAAPTYVSDGSGLTNLFKYTAGLIPNNAASTFSFSVQNVAGQPTHKDIVFSPSFTTRHYTIETSTDLIHWSTLSGPFLGNGGTSTVTDTNAGTTLRFYRVHITNP